jgi:DNA-binding Xre family transcriptional regulator
MIRYYKLFDLLNRKEMKKSELLKVISAPTLGKLQRGDIVKSDTIDKICLYLGCQPSDIMEVFKVEHVTQPDGTIKEIKWTPTLADEVDAYVDELERSRQEKYRKTREEMEKNE